MFKKLKIPKAWSAGLYLVLCGAFAASARGDGAAVLAGGTQSGCAGTTVLHTLTAFYDNCACFLPAPPLFCPITYVSIAQQTGPAMPAVFATAPPWSQASIPCTPPPPGCAAGMCLQQFQVGVVIPPGTPPGTATHQVNITINAFPAIGVITTEVLAPRGECEASAVPSLPEWAGISLAGLLLVAGIFVFGSRRKEPAA